MDKIVIIEDDPGIRTVLRLALKGAGFTDVIAEERGDTINSAPLTLTRSEFDLLKTLVLHPGRVYSRPQILDAIQSEDKDVTDRTVDTLMVGLHHFILAANGRTTQSDFSRRLTALRKSLSFVRTVNLSASPR